MSSKRFSGSRSKDLTSSVSPYLAVGKIFATTPGGVEKECTGFLIARGLVVTHASCILDYGGEIALGSIIFVPGAINNSGDSNSGPIGRWSAGGAVVGGCFATGDCPGEDGEEDYSSSGFTLVLLARDAQNKLPWDKGAKFLKYGSGGLGFRKGSSHGINAGSFKIGQITTLGYPTKLGDLQNNIGGKMVRDDALAHYYSPGWKFDSPHYMWGSPAIFGTGSPIIVNLGTDFYNNSNFRGFYPRRNIVVGIQTGCNSDDVCIGLRIDTNRANSTKRNEDSAGKNWGPGHFGAMMRFACGAVDGHFLDSGACFSRASETSSN